MSSSGSHRTLLVAGLILLAGLVTFIGYQSRTKTTEVDLNRPEMVNPNKHDESSIVADNAPIKTAPTNQTPSNESTRELETPKEPALPPAELAARIDEYFANYWKSKNISPAGPATDGEFLRRTSLDITGKIPTAGEAQEFHADSTPDKRAELVRRLLRHARFSNHLSVTLRDCFLPNAQNDPQKAALLPGFEAWLRLRLADGVGYDTLVREMLTARVNSDANNIGAMRQRTIGPEAFSLAHESKPELIAGNVGRALLGVQIQCAECHDHPFADWKQEQFWSFAALFLTPTTAASASMSAPSLEIAIPNKDKKVLPKFLDGSTPALATPGAEVRRAVVSKWLLENPQFAKAAVNRVWMHFLGRGIVHPAEDFGANNPPSHPEILALLADNFVRSNFDLKYLSEVIATTKVYGLSSRGTSAELEDGTHFAKMPVRSMTPEQFYDSIDRASRGRTAIEESTPRDPFAAMTVGERAQFLRKFWEPGERTGPRGSILHALALMNGNMIARASDVDKGPQLKAIVTSPFLDDAGKIETMYLASLSRMPTESELKKMLEYLTTTDSKDKSKAFSDIYWALLNSSEFALTP